MKLYEFVTFLVITIFLALILYNITNTLKAVAKNLLKKSSSMFLSCLSFNNRLHFNLKKLADCFSGRNGLNKMDIIKARLLFPIRIPIFEGLHNLIKLSKEGVKALEETSAKYGSLFELDMGPMRCIVVADPVIVQKVLCSSQPEHLNKPDIYSIFFVDFFRDGLVNSKYEIWSQHRKMLFPIFSYKSLLCSTKFMNKHAKKLTQSLHSSAVMMDGWNKNEVAIKGKALTDELYFSTFRIIGDVVMGEDQFTAEESAEFTYAFRSYKHLNLERLLNPILLFEPYWKLSPKKKEYDRYRNRVIEFILNSTEKYRKEFEKNIGGNTSNQIDEMGEKPFRCIIEEMLCCGATDKEINDEVGTALGAGHETTVVAIQMLLLHLALNPDHQALCRGEVDKMIDDKHLSKDQELDYELNMDDLCNLNYLKRCILESIRMTPAVPIFVRKLDATLKIDDKLAFPAGTNVALLPWVLHKDPKQFPDPLKFDPDRFLPENVKTRHPYAYIPFSGGARNCIGWKMALLEIKVIMAWVLRYFEIFSEDKFEDVKLLFEVTLRPERDYNIFLKRRRDW